MPDRPPGLEVRPSSIAGQGLFTTVPVAAGTTVFASVGPHLPALLNHSCDPLLGWAGDDLVALVDVPPDAELTTDYVMVIADLDFLLRCHCPSARCRQMVEGTDWRIPQLQRRYAGHWAPAVQRLIDAGPG